MSKAEKVARITIAWDNMNLKWYARVTFDVPWRKGVIKDGLEWPYYRPTSRDRKKLARKALKDLLNSESAYESIEIVTTPNG